MKLIFGFGIELSLMLWPQSCGEESSPVAGVAWCGCTGALAHDVNGTAVVGMTAQWTTVLDRPDPSTTAWPCIHFTGLGSPNRLLPSTKLLCLGIADRTRAPIVGYD